MTEKHPLQDTKHWPNQSQIGIESRRSSSDEQTHHQSVHTRAADVTIPRSEAAVNSLNQVLPKVSLLDTTEKTSHSTPPKTTCLSRFTPYCALRLLPAITASVALLGAITTYQILAPSLTNAHKNFTAENETHLQSSRISTSTAQRKTRTLADGSLIHLGSESEISWILSGSGRRAKLIQGLVYFDISNNPDQAFTVTSGNIEVTTTGTSFDIEKQHEKLTIHVYKGTVFITQHDKYTALTTGQAITLTAEKWHTIEQFDWQQTPSWHNGWIGTNK